LADNQNNHPDLPRYDTTRPNVKLFAYYCEPNTTLKQARHIGPNPFNLGWGTGVATGKL